MTLRHAQHDCAVLRVPEGHELLVTTDFSLEGVHFRRGWHPADAVGHRCLTRGLSDIAAMGGEPLAFFLSLALFALSYAGLGISMWPYIVPQSITIWQAASPQNSQVFMLFGVAVLVPLILGYTAWAYWVFRGKVKHGSGYH